jgi:serine protease
MLGRSVLLFTIAAVLALAQTQQTPVIVILRDGVSFDQYAREHGPDPRAVRNPEAWGYLDRGVSGAVQHLQKRDNFEATQVFSHAVKGFAATLDAGQIRKLQNDPLVESIEIDAPVRAFAQTLPWGVDKIDADLSSTRAGDGAGAVAVNAYIIDTGVAAHPELNVVRFVNFIDTNNTDCHGHGTHVAGTAAAIDNLDGVVGVAPGAAVTALKVLNCSGSGSTSGVIKAVDWVTANAVKPAVANMSLGGPPSKPLDNAVKRSVSTGVLYAVAAGNDAANACNYSPARAGTNAGIVTVAATDINDAEATFSNFGKCVDIWAPGVNILSTYPGGYATGSGTSMASPHAAGAAALYLSLNPAALPSTVEASLKATAKITGTKSRDGRSIMRVNAAGY